MTSQVFPVLLNGMNIYQRLLLTFCIFVAVVAVGGIGFKLMAGEKYSFLECAYNAFVLVSTVDRPFGGALEEGCGIGYRIFTAVLIVSGMGSILYGVSTLTAIIVEGELTTVLRRRRMENRIRSMHDHIIVCGVGETGYYIVEELHKIRVPFVAVESSEQKLTRLKDIPELLQVIGDATEDATLEKAGIRNAAGIILSLPTDQENLYATITARQLNPRIKIISKCINPKSDRKLMLAGANEMVSPASIGGLRMVSLLVRPSVVTFIDKMLRDPDETTRIEEMKVAEGSDIANKTLAETHLRDRASVLVLAVKPPDRQQFIYRPTSETRLEPGAVVVLMGEIASVRKARVLAGMTGLSGMETKGL